MSKSIKLIVLLIGFLCEFIYQKSVFVLRVLIINEMEQCDVFTANYKHFKLPNMFM